MKEFFVSIDFGPPWLSARAALVAMATGLITFWTLLNFTDQPVVEAVPISVILTIALFLLIEQLFNKTFWFQSRSEALPIWDRYGEVIQSDQLLENLPVALIRLSNSGAVEFGNMAARKLIGCDPLNGLVFADLVEGLGRSMAVRVREAAIGQIGRTTELGRCIVDGNEVFLQVTLMQISYVEGDCCMAILTDKTELKALEAQFVQSQKMEAVGQLAGGVAHDFNNLLTAINGHSDLLLLRHKSGDADYGDLIQIRQNSIRAAALVRQLLAFSRKQTLRPKVVNLVDTLKELTKLLNRLLGEKVTLVIKENPDLASVRVDVQQFEQVIVNLVVNARDAMPDGGQVTINTVNLILKQELHRDRATVPAGKYVQVRVSDEGEGIPPDIISKIFEPFFTTKRIGEGTGLGLSTVYGIVKQTGGFVFVKTSKTKGTVFEIYLPAFVPDKARVNDKPKQDKLTKETAKGQILLVEDEVSVRSFAARALKLKGYSVVEAGSGEEALEILQQSQQKFDLFISDVIMPGINGPGWVRKAREDFGQTKVIFVSGYSEDAFSDDQQEIAESSFLPKPFSLVGLSQMVADVLAQD